MSDLPNLGFAGPSITFRLLQFERSPSLDSLMKAISAMPALRTDQGFFHGFSDVRRIAGEVSTGFMTAFPMRILSYETGEFQGIFIYPQRRCEMLFRTDGLIETLGASRVVRVATRELETKLNNDISPIKPDAGAVRRIMEQATEVNLVRIGAMDNERLDSVVLGGRIKNGGMASEFKIFVERQGGVVHFFKGRFQDITAAVSEKGVVQIFRKRGGLTSEEFKRFVSIYTDCVLP